MNDKSTKILDIIKKLAVFLFAAIAIVAILAMLYLSVDYLFRDILSYSSRAVLSNFIVFVGIIAIIFKKVIHPNALIEKAQSDIETKIENSKNSKIQSQKELQATKERIEKIDEEIDEIVRKFKNNASQVGNKILQEAQKSTLDIESDTKKTIKNNQTLSKNDVVKRTSNAIIEIAKMQIINELNKNPKLHDKLIEESIKKITLSEEQIEKA